MDGRITRKYIHVEIAVDRRITRKYITRGDRCGWAYYKKIYNTWRSLWMGVLQENT